MYETHEASKLVFVVQWGGRRETRYTGQKAVFLQTSAPATTAVIKDAIRQSMEGGKRMTIRNIGQLRAQEKVGDFCNVPMH